MPTRQGGSPAKKAVTWPRRSDWHSTTSPAPPTACTSNTCLATGAASGAWLGLFVGLVLSLLSPPGAGLSSILTGLAIGVVFGVVSGAITYGASKGRRDFTSSSQMVAGRYDVLCQPRNAEKARDMLAKLAVGSDQL